MTKGPITFDRPGRFHNISYFRKECSKIDLETALDDQIREQIRVLLLVLSERFQFGFTGPLECIH